MKNEDMIALAQAMNRNFYELKQKQKSSKTEEVQSLRIGERDPDTGKYLVRYPSGGSVIHAQKSFNSGVSYNTVLQAVQADKNLPITLDGKSLSKPQIEIIEKQEEVREELDSYILIYMDGTISMSDTAYVSIKDALYRIRKQSQKLLGIKEDHFLIIDSPIIEQWLLNFTLHPDFIRKYDKKKGELPKDMPEWFVSSFPMFYARALNYPSDYFHYFLGTQEEYIYRVDEYSNKWILEENSKPLDTPLVVMYFSDSNIHYADYFLNWIEPTIFYKEDHRNFLEIHKKYRPFFAGKVYQVKIELPYNDPDFDDHYYAIYKRHLTRAMEGTNEYAVLGKGMTSYNCRYDTNFDINQSPDFYIKEIRELLKLAKKGK